VSECGGWHTGGVLLTIAGSSCSGKTTALAGPVQLNHYAGGHWTVENRLHWTRDVTFGEDDSQLRTGAASRVLASFRNLTINTYRLAGRANTAHARHDLHDRADVFAVYGI
jgi:ABC-type polar amino acid transport system ATPase subunit